MYLETFCSLAFTHVNIQILSDSPYSSPHFGFFFYYHPEVDKFWVFKECMRVLSKIRVYVLQDGCSRKVYSSGESLRLGRPRESERAEQSGMRWKIAVNIVVGT